MQKALGTNWSLEQFVVFYYFWDSKSILLLARLTSVAFAVGTVWWCACLTRRVYGHTAGLMAALLLAVSVLHVRQSPLAAIDIPMTFWFVGATWAAVRLLQQQRMADYLLAGVFIGLAASTKYQGALAAVGVGAAHFLGRRPLLDVRIWTAALAAVMVFLATSPFILLDFSTFSQGFGAVVNHVYTKGEALEPGWWYHLKVSLRYGLGWSGLMALALALGLALWQRRPAVWVLLASFAAYYLIMGAGKLLFVRYALPLVVLQAVFVAGILQFFPQFRWRFLLLVLLVAESLYGSVRVAQLLGHPDTRTEARQWVEAHIPPGATCCNSGNWAGGIPIQTFEHLSWTSKYYVRAFGYPALERAFAFLERHKPPTPFYSYVFQSGEEEQLVGGHGCDYAILHRHPLSNTADSLWTQGLTARGHRLAHFVPQGLAASAPEYDPIDAYYIPLGHFGALWQPGPEIEIWQLTNSPQTKPTRTWNTRQIFARTYAMVASEQLAQSWFPNALGMARRVLALEPENYSALFIVGMIYHETGYYAQAVEAYRVVLELRADDVKAHFNLGTAYAGLDDYANANQAYYNVLALEPDHVRAHYNLGVSYYRMEAYDRAVDHWQKALVLNPTDIRLHSNIGMAYHDLGRPEEALRSYRRGLEKGGDHGNLYYHIARIHIEAQEYQDAVDALLKAVEHNPDHIDALVKLGTTYTDLGENDKAVIYYKKVLSQAPSHPHAETIRQALIGSGAKK